MFSVGQILNPNDRPSFVPMSGLDTVIYAWIASALFGEQERCPAIHPVHCIDAESIKAPRSAFIQPNERFAVPVNPPSTANVFHLELANSSPQLTLRCLMFFRRSNQNDYIVMVGQ